MTDVIDILREGLGRTLDHTDFPELGEKYEGKVRDNYTRGGKRVLITTDRISAFDRVLGTLPYKGQMLNGISAWWFAQTKDVAPNHVLEVPDPNVLIGMECDPLPVELVVRAYLTGVTSTSIWTHYARGERTFCGHELPGDLRKHQKLPQPILTPSTKAEKGGHDESVSRADLLSRGAITARDFDAAAEIAMALYARGSELCARVGLLLVDTKYEMGKTKDGRIVVIDEIHTPDSSRFWYAQSYAERFARGEDPESFDKEHVRRWLAAQGYTGDGPPPTLPDDVRVEASRRYLQACETIRGEPITLDTSDPLPRMRKNLHLG